MKRKTSQFFLNFISGKRLTRFVIVGSIGFFIEAGLLTYFVAESLIGPMQGRLISFPIAVFVTWALNRKITFQSNNPPAIEGLKYFIVQIFAAFCNLALFFVLVSNLSVLMQKPVIPLFFSAALGLVVNFILSHIWVFKK